MGRLPLNLSYDPTHITPIVSRSGHRVKSMTREHAYFGFDSSQTLSLVESESSSDNGNLHLLDKGRIP